VKSDLSRSSSSIRNISTVNSQNIYLLALPRYLSHHSAFTGSSAQINGCSVVEDFVARPCNLNACGISVTEHFSRTRTGASSVMDMVTFQRTGNVGHSSYFFISQHNTSQSVGLHAAFRLLGQLLPFLFGTYVEKVNFVPFVQHLPLQTLYVSITFYVLFLRKQQSQKSPL